jgi:hypothetical protein
MLSFIILGKESYTSNNVDVYFQPLNEELHVLWKGVESFDAYVGAKFTLKAICRWSMHNFPTCGLFASCVIKRHVRCPPCGLNTKF